MGSESADLATNIPQDPATTRKEYIRKADVERCGPTDGCNGCAGAVAVETAGRWPNARTIPRNRACRDQVKQLMENDEEGNP